jgi:hypothetical protein
MTRRRSNNDADHIHSEFVSRLSAYWYAFPWHPLLLDKGHPFNLSHFDPACIILKIACRVDLDDSDTDSSTSNVRLSLVICIDCSCSFKTNRNGKNKEHRAPP